MRSQGRLRRHVYLKRADRRFFGRDLEGGEGGGGHGQQIEAERTVLENLTSESIDPSLVECHAMQIIITVNLVMLDDCNCMNCSQGK